MDDIKRTMLRAQALGYVNAIDEVIDLSAKHGVKIPPDMALALMNRILEEVAKVKE